MKNIKKTKQIISLILVLMMVVAIPANNTVTQANTKSSVAVTKKQKQFDKAFRSEFNKYRKSLNIKKLKTDNKLIRIARVRAKELNVDFSHTRPKGKTLVQLCDAKGVDKRARFIGEIIARVKYNKDNSFADIAKATLKAWKKSSSHNSCIIDSKYKKVGTAFYIANGSMYICTTFTD